MQVLIFLHAAKCPPGYEEAEGGLTCRKCLPGTWKAGWRNDACALCPALAVYDRDEIGMTRKEQCFGNVRELEDLLI